MGECYVNNESFVIEETYLDLTKEICQFIENSNLRNRAAANVLGAEISKKYFSEYNVDTESGLHNVYQILEDFEISDIYVNGNYIDVRLCFNGNDLCVPKSHFETNHIPLAYMFVKLDEDISRAQVLGFIFPENVNKDVVLNNYYQVKESELSSYYDLQDRLSSREDIDLPNNFENLLFDFLDNRLKDTDSFIRLLLESREARFALQGASKSKTIFNFISIPENNSEINPNLETEDLMSNSDNEYENFELIPDDISLEGNINDIPSDIDLEEVTDETEDLSLDEMGDNILLEETENSDFSIENPDSSDFDQIEEQMNLDFYNPVEEEPSILSDNIDNNEEDVETIQLEGSSLLNEEPVSIETVDTTDQIENEQFSTVITPSIGTYDTLEFVDEPTNLAVDEQVKLDESLEQLLDKEPEFEESQTEGVQITESKTEEFSTEEETTPLENVEQESEPIDSLFDRESTEKTSVSFKNKKSSLALPFVAFVAIVGGLGYFAYSKFSLSNAPVEDIPESQEVVSTIDKNSQDTHISDVMPVETVENKSETDFKNEGTSSTIPAIEQNLEASVLVSNLSVAWEVPAGYVANKTAQRYFTKMGKVIQLNLKTELLLLSKPPITNKITLELEYNPQKQSFEIKNILNSSGEKVVDNVIEKTVQKVLNMNLGINTSSFGNISGNPTLIIKL